MRTSSRSVAVLLFDEVELLDVAGPLQVLGSAGRQWNFRPFKIWTLAERPGLVETRSQLRLEAARGLDALPAPEIVIVPGGYGARRALDSAVLLDWLRGAEPGAEVVVGIGYGALLLAKAGLCGDRDVAIPRDVAPLFAELEPTARAVTDARLVRADRVITAAHSAASLDAALAVVARCLGDKQALAVANAIGHAWTPDSGAPAPLCIEIKTP